MLKRKKIWLIENFVKMPKCCLNVVKLGGLKLFGKTISWVEIFLGGNFPGGNYPG